MLLLLPFNSGRIFADLTIIGNSRVFANTFSTTACPAERSADRFLPVFTFRFAADRQFALRENPKSRFAGRNLDNARFPRLRFA